MQGIFSFVNTIMAGWPILRPEKMLALACRAFEMGLSSVFRYRSQEALLAAPKKTTKKAPKKQAKSSGGHPFYILLIMVLLTIILLLVNSQNREEDAKGNDLWALIDSGKKGVERLFEPREEKTAEKKPSPEEDRITGEKEPEEHSAEEIKSPDPEEKDREEQVPKKEAATRKVRLYFLRVDPAGQVSLATATRTADRTSPLKETMEMLARGPSPPEKRRGLLTALPDELRIRSVKVRGNVAYVDLNEAAEYGGGAQIMISRVDQIVYTATQFRGIDAVQITINGRVKKTLGSDGIAISGPLKR